MSQLPEPHGGEQATPTPQPEAGVQHTLGHTADGVATMPGSAVTWCSEALLQGQSAVAIAHNGNIYRLQATRLGKLILTK